MIRSTLAALAFGLVLPQSALACSYGWSPADAVVDVVAIQSAPYPEPNRRNRTFLDWAETRADWPGSSEIWNVEFSQVRVVDYLFGAGPDILTVRNTLEIGECMTGQPLERGERYLLALDLREGEWHVIEGGFVATGEQREAILDRWPLDPAGIVPPFDSNFSGPTHPPPPPWGGPVWPLEPPATPPRGQRSGGQ